MDNCHGWVTHTLWLPMYSTELLITIKILNFPAYNQPQSSCQSHTQQSIKRFLFCHEFSPPGYHEALPYLVWEFWHTYCQLSLNTCMLGTSSWSMFSLLLDLNNISGQNILPKYLPRKERVETVRYVEIVC